MVVQGCKFVELEGHKKCTIVGLKCSGFRTGVPISSNSRNQPDWESPLESLQTRNLLHKKDPMPPKTKGKAFLAQPQKPRSSEPPTPFTRAPPNLEPFLSKLSKEHVYITTVDKTPWDFKAKIFAVPFIMNVVIIGLLLWRIWVVTPYYFQICLSLMGNVNYTTINTTVMTGKQIGYEVARRTLSLLIDLVLYVVLWPWPRAFFGPSRDENPMAWRFSIGFRDQEVTVRRSRKWDEMLGDVVTEGGEGSEGGRLFLTNVRHATSRAFMHEKTGYSMLDKNWDLDWRMMILSTMMVEKKEMSMDDFATTVFVHSEQFGWVVFDAQEAGGSRKEDEGRKKILAFKDKLTLMGKENLFFRWIELVQFESSQPGGFGSERQQEAMRKAKEMFEAQGVDFEKFWAEIGGIEGMPGMDQS
jgi:hypothetical protein